jgi:hypothetical protein
VVSAQARGERVVLARERGLPKRRAREPIEFARSGLGHVSVRAQRDAQSLEAILLRVTRLLLRQFKRSRQQA